MFSSHWLLVLMLISSNIFLNEAKAKYEALKIIGGNETKAGQFNYVMGVLCFDDECDCTGSIIHDKFVITAAHCFFDDNGEYLWPESDPVTIVAGTNDLSDYEDLRRVERDVEKIYAPVGYKHRLTYADDIAVLRLQQNLQLEANNLEKLSLPAKSNNRFYHKQAIVTGFGTSKLTYIEERDGKVKRILHPNSRLHSADVQIVSAVKCNDAKLVDLNICGSMIKDESAENYGTCMGDSGSPLVYKSKVLIGVLCNGPNEQCNERLEGAVYIRVNSYIDFIQKAMNDDTSDMLVKSWN